VECGLKLQIIYQIQFNNVGLMDSYRSPFYALIIQTFHDFAKLVLAFISMYQATN